MRHAVVARQIFMVFRSQFQRRDIAQGDIGSALIDAQRNDAELIWRFKLRLGIDSGIKGLIVHCGGCRRTSRPSPGCSAPRWPIPHNRWLNCSYSFDRSEPDTHRILQAVGIDTDHVADPAYRILYVADNLVGDVLFIHRSIGRDKSHHHHIGVASFAYGHA